MTTNFLYRATEGITEEDLAWMPLEQQDLPMEFRSFRLLREGSLDNETMAKQSVLDRTADDLSELGRITGHLKELQPLPRRRASLQGHRWQLRRWCTFSGRGVRVQLDAGGFPERVRGISRG